LTQRAFAAFRPGLLRVLRHTAVSLLKDAGVPDAVVMALVGHESAAMSSRYTHVGKEALAKAAKTLPEL
jgi:integrase